MFSPFRIIIAVHSKLCASKPFHFSFFNAHTCSKSSKIKGPPWRILFFGTDDFSLQSLKALYAKLRTDTLISSLGVVTKKHSNVCKFSNEEKLPLYYWPIKPSDIDSLYDIGMVVSFGNLITKRIIDSLPLGCINVHASILPRWRGAAPIIYAVLAGDNETGVTIMRIHPHKFDVGEIVRQYRVPISWNETAVELERRLAFHGSQLLMECVRDLPKCVQMAVPQPQTGITYAPKVDPNLSLIDWNSETAQSLFNKHRALSHLYHLRTNWHGQTVKFHSISLDTDTQKNHKPSDVKGKDPFKSALDFLNNPSTKNEQDNHKFTKAANHGGSCSYNKVNKQLKILCTDGQKIIVSKLQIGNKIMNSSDFYNGFMSKRDQSDWTFSTIDCR